MHVPGSRLDQLRVDAIDAKDRGDYNRAIRLAKLYLARRPSDDGVHSFIAGVYREAGRVEEFVAYGRQSLARYPNAGNLLELLKALHSLGRDDEAVALYEEEHRLDRNNVLSESPSKAREITAFMGHLAVQKRMDQVAGVLSWFKTFFSKPKAKVHSEDVVLANIPVAAAPASEKPPAPPPLPEWPSFEMPALVVSARSDPDLLEAGLAALAADELERAVPTQVITGLYLKTDGVEERFHREFSFTHARCEFLEAKTCWAEYIGVGLFLEFEQPPAPEAPQEWWVNRRSRSVFCLPVGALEGPFAELEEAVPPFSFLEQPVLRETWQAACLEVERHVRHEIARLLAPYCHEFEREAHKLNDRLHGEWRARAEAHDRGAEQYGIEVQHALDESIRARDVAALALQEQFAIRVVVKPLELRRLIIPTTECKVRIVRRTSSRELELTWNPLLKHLEPLPCEQCRAQTHSLYVTENLKLKCTKCEAGHLR